MSFEVIRSNRPRAFYFRECVGIDWPMYSTRSRLHTVRYVIAPEDNVELACYMTSLHALEHSLKLWRKEYVLESSIHPGVKRQFEDRVRTNGSFARYKGQTHMSTVIMSDNPFSKRGKEYGPIPAQLPLIDRRHIRFMLDGIDFRLVG